MEYDTLLSAIDELTKPQRRRETQDVIKDHKVIGQQSVTLVHAPLLQQLEEAIAGGVGGGKSKGSTAFERNPLDLDALYRFMLIAETIRQWCRSVKITPHTRPANPAADLRAWYVATLPLNLSLEQQKFYTETLHRWAATIMSKLDPWRERDLPDPCPECGARTWWRDGIEYARPLVVKYKPSGSDLVQQARGHCRACEYVWHVRELAWVLEHPEQHKADSAA